MDLGFLKIFGLFWLSLLDVYVVIKRHYPSVGIPGMHPASISFLMDIKFRFLKDIWAITAHSVDVYSP